MMQDWRGTRDNDVPIIRGMAMKVQESFYCQYNYEGVSKSFRTGRLARELQMVQLSATRCSCIATLWVSLSSFAAITFLLFLNECFLLLFISLSTQ
jgi:hypothetical protein